MPWVVELRAARLGYEGRTVLADLNLKVGPGESVGLHGPNGSGKSTLLKSLLGLILPAQGCLEVLGVRPGGRGFSSVLRRLGYLPQQRSAGRLPLKVREAVAMGRYGSAGLGRPVGRGDWAKVDASLEFAGLAGQADRLVQELSGGQFQRAALARALVNDPELLLLDEPTLNLDREGRRALLELVEKLASDGGRSLLVASHDPELLGLCGRRLDFSAGFVREETAAARV